MEFLEYPKWVKGVIVDTAEAEAELLAEPDVVDGDVQEVAAEPAKRGRKPKAE